MSLGAVGYLRRVRLERPAIGTFNFRDVVTLDHLHRGTADLVPAAAEGVLTVFLVITFAGALAIGLRPVLRPGAMWLGIGTLLG